MTIPVGFHEPAAKQDIREGGGQGEAERKGWGWTRGDLLSNSQFALSDLKFTCNIFLDFGR